MTEKYLNGEGIHKRTRALNDEAWAAVDGAMLSAFAAIIVTGLSFGLLVSSGQSVWWLLLTAPFWVVAAYFWSLWSDAIQNVRRHTAAMAAEREKRGVGWAKS